MATSHLSSSSSLSLARRNYSGRIGKRRPELGRSRQVAAATSPYRGVQSPNKRRTSPHADTPNRQNEATQASQKLFNIESIIVIACGREQRLFLAHEFLLCHSPFFAARFRGRPLEMRARRIDLPNDEPEIFSCMLEYLYEGDYDRRLPHASSSGDDRALGRGIGSAPDDAEISAHTNSALQGNADDDNTHNGSAGAGSCGDAAAAEIGGGRGRVEAAVTLDPAAAVIHIEGVGVVLKDTAVYCLAEKYGLEDLKQLALRKQDRWSGITCNTIVTSARYAYNHTRDSDVKLRNHYLHLILRHLDIFKCNSLMQAEMKTGGKLCLDLFMMMCNYIAHLSRRKSSSSSFFIFLFFQFNISWFHPFLPISLAFLPSLSVAHLNPFSPY